MAAIVFVLLYGISAVTAYPNKEHRIVGGGKTTIAQYPTIVALLYSWSGDIFNQFCGGTILTPKSVLTAAHCVHGRFVSRWRIRVGSTYANSGGVVHSLSEEIIHPGYDRRTLDNDITIMQVADRIIYINNAVQPANIAGAHYNLADDQHVWAAGWGAIYAGGPTSEVLRHVQIWTINQDICRNRYASVGLTVTDNMLCSGWLDVGGRDQCQGDSGGPLYHNNILVGVCSWGRDCALARFPGVNTRVSRFTSWIQMNA